MNIYKDYEKYHDANGLCSDRLPPKVDFNNWLWTGEEILAKHLNGVLNEEEKARIRMILKKYRVREGIYVVPGFNEPQSHDNMRGLVILMWLCAPFYLLEWVNYGGKNGWNFSQDGSIGSEYLGRFPEISAMAKLALGLKLGILNTIYYSLYPAKMLFNPRRVEPRKFIYMCLIIGIESKQLSIYLVSKFWMFIWKRKYKSYSEVVKNWGGPWPSHPTSKYLNM